MSVWCPIKQGYALYLDCLECECKICRKEGKKMLLIIDGSSLLTTSYYGNLPKEMMNAKTEEEKEKAQKMILHASDGTYTNAIYTMLRTVLKILSEQKPSHLAVAFDKSRNTFRRTLYPDYKAQRSETPAPLKEQFILAEQLFESIGVKTLFSDTYEADDYAGSLVRKFRGQIPIRLMTKDHDYTQLVNDEDDVKLWLMLSSKKQLEKITETCGPVKSGIPDRVYELDERAVLNTEGVYPVQIPDLKGICGDASDNIPGIKGVSDKTAVPLLKEYSSLDNILQVIQDRDSDALAMEWKKKFGFKQNPVPKLQAGSNTGLLSKELATIYNRLPINYSLPEFDSARISKDTLRKWCERLELKSINV